MVRYGVDMYMLVVIICIWNGKYNMKKSYYTNETNTLIISCMFYLDYFIGVNKTLEELFFLDSFYLVNYKHMLFCSYR